MSPPPSHTRYCVRITRAPESWRTFPLTHPFAGVWCGGALICLQMLPETLLSERSFQHFFFLYYFQKQDKIGPELFHTTSYHHKVGDHWCSFCYSERPCAFLFLPCLQKTHTMPVPIICQISVWLYAPQKASSPLRIKASLSFPMHVCRTGCLCLASNSQGWGLCAGRLSIGFGFPSGKAP